MSHKRTAPLPSPENSWYSLHGDQQMHHAPFLQDTAQVSTRQQKSQPRTSCQEEQRSNQVGMPPAYGHMVVIYAACTGVGVAHLWPSRVCVNAPDAMSASTRPCCLSPTAMSAWLLAQLDMATASSLSAQLKLQATWTLCRNSGTTGGKFP
jgi:hypothetical protein